MLVCLDFILEFTGLSDIGWDTIGVPHVLHWLLHFPPVLYAAYIFGVRGVVTITVIMMLLCMPDSLFLSPDLDHLFADTSFITLAGAVGALIAFLRNQREQIRKVYTAAIESREALQESEGKHRGLVSNIKLGIFRTTPGANGKFLAVNPALAEITGYPEEELLQMNVSDLYVNPAEREAILEGIALAAGKTTTELNFRKKDGTEIIVSDTKVAVRDSAGKILYFDGILEDITERKRAEEALRESRKRYLDLVNFLPQTIFELDERGNLIFASAHGAQAFGYTLEDRNKGLSIHQMFIPEDRDRAIENMRSVLSGKETRGYEYTALRKDGSTFPVISYSAPIIRGGKPMGLTGVLMDITERKQAEETLRESEEKYKTLVEIAGEMGEGIAVVQDTDDQQTSTVFLNAHFPEMLGYKREEMIGKPVWQFLPTDSLAILRDRYRRRQKGENVPSHYETAAVRKDGTLVPIEVTMAVTTYEGKTASVAFVRDITERKRAEEASQESEERYRSIVELAPDGIVTISPEGLVTSCNTAFLQLSGFSEGEIVGKYFLELPTLLEQDMPIYATVFSAVLAGEQPPRFEFTWRHKDGSLRLAEADIGVMSVGDNSRGLQAIIRDITERKQAEEREKQLQQELSLASRLASIGEMASGVAHEINNPLTGVIGFSQLLMSKDIPDNIRDNLQVIHSEAQRVARIVAGLLTFARQRQPGRERTDINDTLSAVMELRSYEMKVNNIEVETRLAPDLPKTMADASQLQQVFLNIALNAEKEMIVAHNRGRLSVKTEKIDDFIRVSFSDDGPGISRENLEKIFDPFFTTREVGNGTGLGLSICHGIITQHHGKIYARSELGKGATFIIELPIVSDTGQTEAATVIEEESRQQSGARILVVDDETAILDFLKRLLTKEGYRVETLNRAQAALERLQSEQYDLILLDIKMPGMSGIDLYYRIEAIDPALTQRTMFITGDVMETTTKDFLDKTKAPHIAKPINIEQLKKEINQILVSELELYPA
jgi:PAS domain S-box-containing protein